MFLDIDGTLINAQGIIPESTKLAIKKAKENGHKMVLCSGRGRFQLPEELLRLDFDGIISSDGAAVLADNQVIYNARIHPEQREHVAKYLESGNAIYYFMSSENMILSEENKTRVFRWLREKDLKEDYLGQMYKSFQIQENVWENNASEKLVYHQFDKTVEQVHRDLLPYFDVAPLSMYGSDEFCGEIRIAGINKATALEIYLKHVGIERENSIALGDGANDIQMITYAGCGVAMGNALDELKKQADFVTDDIDNDGVYRAFEKLGLLEEDKTSSRKCFQHPPKFKLRLLMLALGVLVQGFGLSLLLKLNLGADPFSNFIAGLDLHLPLSFGTIQLIINILMVIYILIFNRQMIGYGSIANMAILGYIIDFFNLIWNMILPADLLSNRIFAYLMAIPLFLCVIIGASFYMTVGLGTGPYDGIPFIVANQLKKPFKYCRMIWDICFMVIGYLLGGGLGLVTIVLAFFAGPIINAVKQQVEKLLNDK